MTLEIQNNWLIKYGIVSHRRFFKKDKIRFLHHINEEFTTMGYSTSLLYPLNTKGEASDLLIGDVKQAKTIIVVPYDTPIKTLGLFPYAPFDFRNYKIKYLVAVAIPLFAVFLTCFFFSLKFLKLDWLNGNFFPSDLLVLFLYLIGIIFIVRYSKGIPNSKNINRNSSGIITLLTLAYALKDNKSSSFAFALTDHGCSNRMGDLMLKEYLGADAAQKNFIVLNCVGMGNSIGINYSESTKNTILLSGLLSNKTIALYPEDGDRFSAASLYNNCIMISCTDNPENDKFVVGSVNTRKDTDLDWSCINALKELVCQIIQTS